MTNYNITKIGNLRKMKVIQIKVSKTSGQCFSNDVFLDMKKVYLIPDDFSAKMYIGIDFTKKCKKWILTISW